MTKEQFDSLYYGKAVHCDTEEKAKEFLALADSVGYKWFKEESATKYTKWQIFKDDTHYFVKEFWIGINSSDNFLKYDIDCVEFIQQSKKFKVGDMVRVNNPSFTTLNGEVGVIVEVDTLSPLSYAVKIGHGGCTFWLFERQLEKFEEQICKEETTKTLIDEIKAKWSEINILLNRLEKKEKGK